MPELILTHRFSGPQDTRKVAVPETKGTLLGIHRESRRMRFTFRMHQRADEKQLGITGHSENGFQ